MLFLKHWLKLKPLFGVSLTGPILILVLLLTGFACSINLIFTDYIDPFDSSIYVFCNGRRNRLKILEWDGDGFWLYFKRLEKGHFRWPGLPVRAGRKASDQGQPGDDPTMRLNPQELTVLLGGVKVELRLKRNEVFERNIS